jgi:hypothetical protein
VARGLPKSLCTVAAPLPQRHSSRGICVSKSTRFFAAAEQFAAGVAGQVGADCTPPRTARTLYKSVLLAALTEPTL